MFRKIIYALWVLINICFIFEGGRQSYQYYISGDITGAIMRLIFTIGFTLLTVFIIYRDIKDYTKLKNK